MKLTQGKLGRGSLRAFLGLTFCPKNRGASETCLLTSNSEKGRKSRLTVLEVMCLEEIVIEEWSRSIGKGGICM